MTRIQSYASTRKNRHVRIALMALSKAWDAHGAFKQWAIGAMVMIPLSAIVLPILHLFPAVPASVFFFIIYWTVINISLAFLTYFIHLRFYLKDNVR